MGVKAKNSIDLVKLIMAVFVVAIHTDPLAGCQSSVLRTLLNTVLQMAVPFFFLSSGYLLGAHFPDLRCPEGGIPALKRQLGKLLKMYLIWSAIYLPLAIYGYRLDGVPLGNGAWRYVKSLVLIGDHYNSWQLWYLLSAVYGFAFLLLLLKAKASPRILLLCSLLVSTLSFGMDALAEYPHGLPGLLSRLRYAILVTTWNGRILRGLVYIPIGLCMAHREVPLKNPGILLASCLVCRCLTNAPIASDYLILVGSVSLFAVVLKVDLKDRPVYPVLRQLSTGVYLIHMYVWTFYYLLVYREKQFGADSFVATVVICLALCLPYVLWKRKSTHKKLRVFS